jgi:hypothetical protein
VQGFQSGGSLLARSGCRAPVVQALEVVSGLPDDPISSRGETGVYAQHDQLGLPHAGCRERTFVPSASGSILSCSGGEGKKKCGVRNAKCEVGEGELGGKRNIPGIALGAKPGILVLTYLASSGDLSGVASSRTAFRSRPHRRACSAFPAAPRVQPPAHSQASTAHQTGSCGDASPRSPLSEACLRHPPTMRPHSANRPQHCWSGAYQIPNIPKKASPPSLALRRAKG